MKIHADCYIAQFTVIEEDAFLAPGVQLRQRLVPRGRRLGSHDDGTRRSAQARSRRQRHGPSVRSDRRWVSGRRRVRRDAGPAARLAGLRHPARVHGRRADVEPIEGCAYAATRPRRRATPRRAAVDAVRDGSVQSRGAGAHARAATAYAGVTKRSVDLVGACVSSWSACRFSGRSRCDRADQQRSGAVPPDQDRTYGSRSCSSRCGRCVGARRPAPPRVRHPAHAGTGARNGLYKLAHDSGSHGPGPGCGERASKSCRNWNVLRGEMSLVGPRPSLPWEVEMFPPWALPRFEVHQG